MRDAWDDGEVLTWMREHPTADGYELTDLAERFGWERDRLRDRLRRRVNAGELLQSAPAAGYADNNPSYSLPDRSADDA
jgi:hypothetical protein